MDESRMKILSGMGRFPVPGGGCRHKDSGWFLYYDDEEFRLVFECEDDDQHDLEITGKWNDGSPIAKMRLVIERWKRDEYGRCHPKVGGTGR
jgi:hypothetical protein